jgi:hypothetical protein
MGNEKSPVRGGNRYSPVSLVSWIDQCQMADIRCAVCSSFCCWLAGLLSRSYLFGFLTHIHIHTSRWVPKFVLSLGVKSLLVRGGTDRGAEGGTRIGARGVSIQISMPKEAPPATVPVKDRSGYTAHIAHSYV